MINFNLLKKNITPFIKRNKYDSNTIIGNKTQINGSIVKLKNDSKLIIGSDCLLDGIFSLYTSNAKITIGNNVFIGRDRKSTRLNSSHIQKSRMPSSA